VCASELRAEDAKVASLSLSSASALAGEPAGIDLILSSSSRNIAALALVVEFDASRLSFETAASRDLMNVPEGFEIAIVPAGGPGRVGISLFDPRSPFSTLESGRILRLPFLISHSTAGFASVVVAMNPPPDASTTDEVRVNLVVGTSGGIMVTPRRGILAISPGTLDFGSAAPGETFERILVMSNIGTDELTLSRLELQSTTGEFFFPDVIALPQLLGPGASIQVRVAFRSAEPGEFQALVVADGSTATKIVPLAASAVRGSGFVYASRAIIPSVAHLEGAGGASWRSTLSLFNAGATRAGVRLTLLPAGSGPPPPAVELTLAPRQTMLFNDLVAELFDRKELAGALLVEASSPDLVARGAAYNLRPDGGRVGQSLPTLGWAELLRTGEKGSLIGLARNDERRTNLGLLNLGSAPATLRLTLLDGAGSVLVTREYALSPHEILLAANLFDAADLGTGENLTVIVEATTPDATFLAYASTIDNRSGSPLFQSAR